jgi:hypothetical protein
VPVIMKKPSLARVMEGGGFVKMRDGSRGIGSGFFIDGASIGGFNYATETPTI